MIPKINREDLQNKTNELFESARDYVEQPTTQSKVNLQRKLRC